MTCVLVACATAAAARAARAQDARATADAGVDLVVFHGPAAPSAPAGAARATVEARARDAGLAWLDVSPAAPPPSEAPVKLRAGIDAYDELRWEDARAALTAAADEVWRTGGEGLSTSELSDVFLYRGLAETQLGNAAHAWDDLVRASTLVPTRTLDPMRFAPRTVEAFDRARAAVAALPRARLTVAADAACAVAIDGGAAMQAEVAHGEHAVRVECPGRAAWGARVAVAGDQTVTPPDAPAPAPPDDEALGAEARARGAAALLVVTVTDAAPDPTIVLRVVDARGRASRRASIQLGGDLDEAAAASALDAALDRLLAPAPTAVIVRPAEAPWWKSRWVWLAAGAVVTAAITVPLLAGDDGGDGGTFTLRPEWTW